MLEATGLCKNYGKVTAVSNASLSIEPGHIVGIVGNNGAGKTTIIKMISGLIEPTAGKVRLGGRNPLKPSVRSQLGLLPEDSPLYDDMTPIAYLKFFGRIHKMPKERIERRTKSLLTRLRLAEKHWTKPIGQLSKGSARKVALARALLHNPGLLILDEPRSGLDPATQAVLDEFLMELRANGKAIILSAHDLDQVERICDQVLVVSDGEIALRGTVDELRENAGPTTYAIRATIPFTGSSGHGSMHEGTAPTWAAAQQIMADVQARFGNLLDIRAQPPRLADVLQMVQ